MHRSLTNLANSVLKRVGAEMTSSERLERYRRLERKFVPVWGPSYADGESPQIAIEYLRSDNPRLLELRSKYQSLQCPATNHSFWKTDYVGSIPLLYFRGDNPYVWQYQDDNSEIAHLLTAYYLQTQDRLGLLDSLPEDGLFGAYTFSFNGERRISRDLLDSVNEITFLEQEFGITKLREPNILDIGAGYGRLAYRLAEALPNLGTVFATDAVPESTFISEFYLDFRGVNHKTTVVPLHEIETVLNEQHVDYALNIHSFSECCIDSIRWWLDLVAKARIRHLIIVPNNRENGGMTLTSTESGRERVDFAREIEARSYKRVLLRPKYLASSVQQHGVSPTYYHVYEFQG